MTNTNQTIKRTTRRPQATNLAHLFEIRNARNLLAEGCGLVEEAGQHVKRLKARAEAAEAKLAKVLEWRRRARLVWLNEGRELDAILEEDR